MTLEQEILQWHKAPESHTAEIVAAITSGNVLLVSKEKLGALGQNIERNVAERNELRQELADVQHRYNVLLEALTHLLQGCEGVAVNVPAAIDFFKSLDLMDTKSGEINWAAVIGLATSFTMPIGGGKKKVEGIKQHLAALRAGLDLTQIAQIPIRDVLGIIREHGHPIQGYEQAFAALFTTPKTAENQ